MATWSEKYVDLSAGSNGSGTSGSPWNSFDNAVTGLGTVSVPIRVNVKGAQTTATGANIGINPAGVAQDKVVWWRGYLTTIGDLDNDFVSQRPKLTVQTGVRVNFTSAWQRVSNIEFTGNYDFSGLLRPTGSGPYKFVNLKITNVSANAAAAAVGVAIAANAAVTFNGCHLTANAAASGVIDLITGALYCNGCILDGGIAAVFMGNTGNSYNCTICNTVLHGTTYGINCANTTTRTLILNGCTFFNPSSDAVRVGVTIDAGIVVIDNCLFSTVGGYGVKNTSGTDTGMWEIDCPDYYSLTSGQTNGLTDDAATGDGSARAIQTESADPLVNAGAGDYTPKSTSNAIANAYPGVFA